MVDIHIEMFKWQLLHQKTADHYTCHITGSLISTIVFLQSKTLISCSGSIIKVNLYNQLYPTAENVPKFYGLPKIHKKDVPLRPIVSSIGSMMYDTAKFLAKIMKPLVGLNSHHIVNSEDFVNKIAEL